MLTNEKKFYNELERIFEGEHIDGEGGFVNLLHIKQKYYNKVINEFKKEVDSDSVVNSDFKEYFFTLLFTFFSKYFSESGSIYFTKTRAEDKIYEKVYENGKDVSLFWKTNMLYYVKTDMLYKNILVTVKDDTNDDYSFYFDVSKLEQKKNNEKIELHFVYRETQVKDKKNIFVFDVINKGKDDFDRIITNDLTNELIEKAINTFKKQSEVDFFINKNARQFLTEQLDLFIHTRLLDSGNEFNETELNQWKTFKKYACKLIDFISQFENELVRIWNKPKFVLNSNYVISLDKINDSIKDKIKKHKNLQLQVDEWKKLGMIDDTFSFNEVNLLSHSHLPIDTKYFKDLELEIIGQFENLDEVLDGRLIHSENYQALNTMQNRYREKIQCIYIDPPFNTGKDFEYIDGYQDSTWLTLMWDRINLIPNLLTHDGSFYLHLDYNANVYGKYLIEQKWNDITEIIFNTNGTKDEESDLYANKSFGKNFQLKHQTIYYCRNQDFIYNKLWKPNRRETQLNIGWLDVISKAITESPNSLKDFEYYIDAWVDGKFQKKKLTIDEKIYPIGDIWNDIYSFTQSEMRTSENVSFEGQKPENLMRRIIQTSTNCCGIVCDFFCGSGTTICTAQKLNRKWLGIEMGNHFKEFYLDEKDAWKIGLMGRIKNIINGDQKFEVPNSDEKRKSHLSKDLNWQGGGFFKYYSLEQYEDTLRKVNYDENDIFYTKDTFSQYPFFADKKLVDVLNSKDFSLDFNRLYENIDLPETISLLLGKPIKRITEDEVFLSDEETPIKYNTNKMTNEEKIEFVHLLKPLLWWGE